MTKRDFLKLALMGIANLASAPVWGNVSGNPGRTITTGAISFVWRHESKRLFCEFIAPTSGWVAVGFNSQKRLGGTRFLMAVPADRSISPEEHLATPPTHQPVGDHGLEPVIRDIALSYQRGQARLALSFPHIIQRPASLRLNPGAQAYLMLAWSRAADFGHHSAWRRHFSITL